MDLRTSLTLLILTAFAVYCTEGIRGGGSRGGGSRRGGISSRGGGSRVRSGGAVRSNYHGPRYSGGWKTAAVAGTLYGLSSYKRRRLYHDNPNSEPTICFNEKDLRNETFGYFICPEDFEDDSFTSCCGDDDAQYCCEGLSGVAIGAIVGGVLGAIVLFGVIIAIVLVLKNRQRRPKRGAVPAQSMARNHIQTVQYTTPNSPASEPTGLSNIYSTQSDFSAQTDGQKAPIGFEGSMSAPSSEPPPYSDHGKY